MKRRTFQAGSRGSAPPPAEPARGSQHIVLRIVLIAFVALFLAEFVPAPWAFHIGSRFTPLGQWDGYGPVQASDGGRYLLFTHLQGGVFAHGGRPGCFLHGGCNTLRGSAKLCTRERAGVLVHPDRHDARLADHRRVGHQHRPVRRLAGPAAARPGGGVDAWHGPVLPVASTDGSFTEAFTPPGRSGRPPPRRTHGRCATSDGSATAFGQACHTLAAAPADAGRPRASRRGLPPRPLRDGGHLRLPREHLLGQDPVHLGVGVEAGVGEDASW